MKISSSSLAFLCIAGLLRAADAPAQIGGFVAGGLGANTVQVDLTSVSPGSPDVQFTSGKSNIPALQLEGGARFGSGDMSFGIGVYYHPLTYKGDEQNFAPTKSETRVKNLMGLFGEIGWKAAPPTVIYGRLSYNQAKVETELTGPGMTQTYSKTFDGYGFGAGVRHMVGSSVYVFVDWHHIMGNQVDLYVAPPPGTGTLKVKPSLTTGLIGAGWSF